VVGAPRAALKFARGAVSDAAQRVVSVLLLRLSLVNGPYVRLEFAGVWQLGEVLGIFERAACLPAVFLLVHERSLVNRS
jgi:hypothetical protein